MEELTRRRLPVAMALLMSIIAATLPIETYYHPERLVPYAAILGVELVACGFAWVAMRRRPDQARTIATVWAAVLGCCIASYYPLVGGDATLALAALICLVAAVPAILPFALRHQLTLCTVCALAFLAILHLGAAVSLQWPYMFMAYLSVMSASSLGARSIEGFRWEACRRELILEEAQRHLSGALARAESAAEMRSRLVANVSHELRTPLNVIIGYSDMLLDGGSEPAAVASAAPRIRDYAVSLETLVSRLLDVSRLSSGKVELALEDVDLAALLADVAHAMRLQLRGRDVTVKVDCGVERCRSDRMRLAQILTNLATNAAKFTEHGSITLSARDAGDALVLQVRDTGCGIPTDAHERIFSAFEQIAPASKSAGGIGLGLAIVRQLTDLLGGRVTVASAPGAGATFTVTLPHRVAAPVDRNAPVAA